MVFLDGFGLAGYRSFGDELQLMAPFKQLNLFIGKNNSGKSNILTFLYRHLHMLGEFGNLSEWQPEETDRHIGSANGKFKVALGIRPSIDLIGTLLDNRRKLDTVTIQAFMDFLTSPKFPQQDGVSIFRYWSNTFGDKLELDVERMSERFKEPYTTSEVRALNFFSSHLLSFRSLDNNIFGQLLSFVHPLRMSYPKTYLIPAVRSVSNGELVYEDFSGLGLVLRLAQLQNPNHGERQKRTQFDRITAFVQNVLENDSAQIEIPYQRDTILVHMDGKVLPLSALGTGIHEVVILAAAATVIDNSIICLEEPESHIHPTLQRKLIQYLTSTTNQYFITTHSSHLVDTELAAVFHVQLVDGASKVDLVSTANGRFAVCADLGYRASDLVQANSIVWVEGPSDRIYVKYWLTQVDSELVEGVHYSIMFYGGALRSHLSGSDLDESVINDFISLRRLNRNMVMLMDSDKNKAEKGINETKTRLKNEFDKGPGFCWITQGREIENYLSQATISRSIEAVYPGAIPIRGNQYDRMLRMKRDEEGEIHTDLDKVAIARKVVEAGMTLDQLDLREQVIRLANFIRSVNSL